MSEQTYTRDSFDRFQRRVLTAICKLQEAGVLKEISSVGTSMWHGNIAQEKQLTKLHEFVMDVYHVAFCDDIYSKKLEPDHCDLCNRYGPKIYDDGSSEGPLERLQDCTEPHHVIEHVAKWRKYTHGMADLHYTNQARSRGFVLPEIKPKKAVGMKKAKVGK